MVQGVYLITARILLFTNEIYNEKRKFKIYITYTPGAFDIL